MPLPWELAFQEPWLALIAAFGARYESNPRVRYVIINGIGQENGLAFCETIDKPSLEALAVSAGYANLGEAWVTAAELLIDAHAEAFPETSIIIGNYTVPWAGGSAQQNAVKDYGEDNYPGHFGTMITSLRATPGPHSGSVASANPHGAQMFQPARGNPDQYVPPPPDPYPADPQCLQDTCDRAAKQLGHQFIEMYSPDLRWSGSQSVLAQANVDLALNVL
jgi:hypothetical protein